MELTWDPSFKPFLRYSYLGFLPPFSQNIIMGFVTTIGIGTSLIRAILLFMQKGAFVEKVCNVSILTQQILRGIIFLWKRKSMNEFGDQINQFIKDHKFNPIIDKEDYFLNIWKKNDAFTYAKWYFLSVLAVCIIWKIPILIHLSNNYETVSNPYYALVSPYFAYNSYTKWIYTIVDIHLDLFWLFNSIHTEMVFISFLKFLYCQYLYSKQLLDEIYVGNRAELEDPRILKWWFENHCEVLKFSRRAKQLLEPIITVNYICFIVAVASCIVILVEDKSVQSLFQKFLLIALFVILLFQLGCHCNTVETINEVNMKMNENLSPYNVINGKIKTNVIFNMINFISIKPVIFSGYGFFNFNNKEYKDLLMTTYSFYSTLMSFKK